MRLKSYFRRALICKGVRLLLITTMNTTYFTALAKAIVIILFISFVPSRLNAQQIAIGTYTGNGGTAQNISGLGFTPVAVLVQKAGSATAFIGTNTMGGNVKLNDCRQMLSFAQKKVKE